MLTDSGTNAMSDNQLSAMMRADDAYAGSQSFERLLKGIEDVLGKKYFLPVHQGRAAENIIARTFVKPGQSVLTNYHFTTTLAHVQEMGARVAELYYDRAMELKSDFPCESIATTHGKSTISNSQQASAAPHSSRKWTPGTRFTQAAVSAAAPPTA